MPHLLRILSWLTVVAVVGYAMPASAQLRSWQQGARPFALRSAPQSPAVNPPTAAPTTQFAVPQPAASPWLPQTVTAPDYRAAAPHATQNVAASPGVRPIARYPLPNESQTIQASASATLGTPHAPTPLPQATTPHVQPRNSASISPYAATFLAAQQPTPAPPLTGPANAQPIVDGASQWTLPGLAGAPQAEQVPMPQGGSFDMLSPSCDPAEIEPAQVWEEPFDPGIPVKPARGCGPWFLSVSGLILSRGVPNNVELTSSSSDPEFTLINSERVGTDEWLGGVEFRLGRMVGDRWAVEFDYWSLEAQSGFQSVYDPNNGLNSRLNFEDLSYQGSPLSDVFDNSREQRFFRSWNAENIEINLLQQAMIVDPIDRFGMTMFSGVRYFRFDELWHYEAAAANSEFSDGDPNTQSNYWILLKNRMVGWQVGGRGHVRIGNRLRLFAMPRFGVMGTRIGQQQHVCMIIEQHSTKNDVALLGQLDVGMSVQVLPCFSLFGSYRAMGIAGMAIADDNVARSFQSPATMESINSSSSLILHGWQIGAQWQF